MCVCIYLYTYIKYYVYIKIVNRDSNEQLKECLTSNQWCLFPLEISAPHQTSSLSRSGVPWRFCMPVQGEEV